MNSLVSIIIPTFNSEKFIKNSILSAIEQSYKFTEIIVIDDGSTDNTLDIVRSFGDMVRWESQSNQGAAVARNRGLKLAQGTFIKFLDADDILLPDCLEKQVALSQELSTKSKAIVYGDAQWIDQDGRVIRSSLPKPRQPRQDQIAHILSQCPLTSCPLHRRDYLEAIGGFNPTLTRKQEHDLHLRLVLSGVEFIHHPDIVYQYRQHNQINRLSGQSYAKYGPLVHYEILQNQCRLIESVTGTSLSPSVRQVLSQQFWALGREILREGYRADAEVYFETARSLDRNRCIVGHLPYPLLVRWLGPYHAELGVQILKQILKRVLFL